jgi:hypothetical protein
MPAKCGLTVYSISHFCPHTGGGAWPEQGIGAKPLYLQNSANICSWQKTWPFFRRLSASQTSEHFLPEVIDVVINMLIKKSKIL